MKKRLDRAEEEHRKIIYVDEAVFSFKTFKTNAWASPYTNLKIDNSKIRLTAQALVAGISEDKGLEHYLLNKKSIKVDEFKVFMEEL